MEGKGTIIKPSIKLILFCFSDYRKLAKRLEKDLGLKWDTSFQETMDSFSAETGIRMANYLYLCPRGVFDSPWVKYLKKLIKQPLGVIVTNLNRLLIVSEEKNDRFVKGIVEHILEVVKKKYPLHNENLQSLNIKNTERLQRITNHPVHIVDEDKVFSPSSFIPFCEFGGNMSMMGMKINNFDFPICNSFRPTILENRLCYKVDVSEIVPKPSLQELFEGLILVLDYNEDRQFYKPNSKSMAYEEQTFAKQGLCNSNESLPQNYFI